MKSKITYNEEDYWTVVQDIKPLIEAHWEEIALHKDKIKLDPDWEMYEAMNSIGRLRIYTARDEEFNLVGYFIVVLNKHMHYSSHLFALNDILYIKPELRGGLVAFRMMKHVETALKDLGVDVLVVNMKVHSPFDKLMEGLKFKYTERVYSKYIGD